MKKHPAEIHIGTSGWHYDHWKGPFYPENIESEKMLSFYKKHFRTTEINNSFYRLPQQATLDIWKNSVPAGFVFSVKGSRYITHMKKLKTPSAGVPPLLEAVEALGEKLGPILFQLPPRWHINLERLEAFLEFLPHRFRYAFEFRDSSWFARRTYEILASRGAAFCLYHLAGQLSPKEVTADFVYVRLHGPGKAYQGSYDNRTLAGWADAFSAWRNQGREIFCYFDNDQNAYAVRDALRLQEMFSGE
jgi:uncharacterized protein YecE (DUF72 family)